MKAALLFPGQGAQYVGMGKDLYDSYIIVKQLFDEAASVLDWDVREVCFTDSHALINQTRYTQAALFTTNYAIYKVLEANGLKADAMLGFSLGEYDAITASGALDFKTALTLVDKRATYMEEAANKNPGGMSAVIGLGIEEIKAVCEAISEESHLPVEVANDNCEGQVTIAGVKEALELASLKLKEAGAKRVLPLKVSGDFHSSLMEEAKEKLAKELVTLDFKEPQVEVISNVSAGPMNREEIIENIPLQVVKGVRFRESIHYLVSQGFDTFIEVGPKCTLSNLVKKMAPEATILNVEDSDTLRNVLEKVGRGNA